MTNHCLIIAAAFLTLTGGVVYGGDCYPPKDTQTDISHCTYTETNPNNPNQTITTTCSNRIPFTEQSTTKSKTSNSSATGACGYKDILMTKECPKYNHVASSCNE